MSDDWNTVTHIGKSRNGGNGGGQRMKVISTSSGLNAARLAGGVVTEKKVTSANSKPNLEGQRIRKIDEADGPVAVPKNPPGLAAAFQKALERRDTDATKISKKLGLNANLVRQVLNTKAAKSDTKLLTTLQNELGVKLLGSDIGSVTNKGKRMDEEAAAAKKAEAAKEAAAAKKEAAKEAVETDPAADPAAEAQTEKAE